MEFAAERFDTFTHADQPESRTRFCQIDPRTVVGHGHHDLAVACACIV